MYEISTLVCSNANLSRHPGAAQSKYDAHLLEYGQFTGTLSIARLSCGW